MYTRIVVPLDGSDLAEQALETAEEMAGLTGATLHLVRVVEFPPTDFTFGYGNMMESGTIETRLTDERTLAEEYLSAVARPLDANGIKITTETRHGVAIQELVDAMKPGDLFVVASHGRTGVARWFLGSVAEELVRRSTVPVLLVRARTSGSRRREQNGATVST